LDKEEMAILTGRKSKKHQIDALRRMSIPFFVNANGLPVVARAAIEGKQTTPPRRTWMPRA
jgi:hypothetical protein